MTPEEITLAFISDYKIWNDMAFSLSDFDDAFNEEAEAQIEREYEDMIQKYCPPDKVYQGISYGSESSHDPEIETIEEVSITNTTAIVNTHMPDNDNYEFSYIRTNSQWYLDEIYYLADGEKYPCL